MEAARAAGAKAVERAAARVVGARAAARVVAVRAAARVVGVRGAARVPGHPTPPKLRRLYRRRWPCLLCSSGTCRHLRAT